MAKKISDYTAITSTKKDDLIDVSEYVSTGVYQTRSITKKNHLMPKYLLKTFSAAPTFDLEEIFVQEMPLTGHTVPTLSNKVNGGTYIITFEADGTAGRTITPDGTFGSKDDSSEDVTASVAYALYIFTIVVRPTGDTFYTINTIGT